METIFWLTRDEISNSVWYGQSRDSAMWIGGSEYVCCGWWEGCAKINELDGLNTTYGEWSLSQFIVIFFICLTWIQNGYLTTIVKDFQRRCGKLMKTTIPNYFKDWDEQKIFKSNDPDNNCKDWWPEKFFRDWTNEARVKQPITDHWQLTRENVCKQLTQSLFLGLFLKASLLSVRVGHGTGIKVFRWRRMIDTNFCSFVSLHWFCSIIRNSTVLIKSTSFSMNPWF